ncbi:MAG: DUF4923 family protein [Clostridiales bacterium]|nr:DUF4923 family protein [Clostridiales bacterium]
MKRILSIILVAMLVSFTFTGNAFDLKGALKKAASSANNADSTSTGSNGGLGGLLGGLGNILGVTDVNIKDLAGTWNYAKPAVAFKSDNLLKKAGGEAAASVLEGKLAPYYQKAGITSLQLTVNNDSTFTMAVKKVTLKGKLTKDEEGNFIFNFQALGKMNLGHLTSVITKSGNNIDVTFDASKLVSLVSKIAAVTGNSTVKTVSSLLESYDGLNAGFQLARLSDNSLSTTAK